MTLYGITKSVNSHCVSGVSTGTGFSGIFAILALTVIDHLRETTGVWVSVSPTRSNEVRFTLRSV